MKKITFKELKKQIRVYSLFRLDLKLPSLDNKLKEMEVYIDKDTKHEKSDEIRRLLLEYRETRRQLNDIFKEELF